MTDSDIEFPGGTSGVIAGACSKAVSQQPHAVTRHVATTGRELENTIPISLLAPVVERTHPEEWQQYVDCETTFGKEALQYADLKNGMTLCALLSKRPTAPERTFWLGKVREQRAVPHCVNNERCDQSAHANCTILPGFGDRTAEHVQASMERESVRKMFNVAQTSHNFDAWLKLGEDVFFAGAAPKRLRV
ncbi:MAG: hypothetical protein P4L81_07495 [Candidatus Pacebacteria bacterium]|nr:hypothetical protein [Candidatus Paceibacterota bacterium]